MQRQMRSSSPLPMGEVDVRNRAQPRAAEHFESNSQEFASIKNKIAFVREDVLDMIASNNRLREAA